MSDDPPAEGSPSSEESQGAGEPSSGPEQQSPPEPSAATPPLADTPTPAPPIPDPSPSPNPRATGRTDMGEALGSFVDAISSDEQRRPSDPSTAVFVRSAFAQALRAPFLRGLLKVPLKKVAIWGSFLLLLYFARQFFGVIFLTFVISYISSTIVGRIARFFTNRKIPVLIVFATIVGLVVALGFATVPRAVKQGKAQLDKLDKIRDPVQFLEEQLVTVLHLGVRGSNRASHPAVKELAARLTNPELNSQVTAALVEARMSPEGSLYLASRLELILGKSPLVEDLAKQLGDPMVSRKLGRDLVRSRELRDPRTFFEQNLNRILGDIPMMGNMAERLGDPAIGKAISEFLTEAQGKYLIPGLTRIWGGLWGGVLNVLLALVFSFMIVWDVPRISQGVGRMKDSRLGDVWVEVAPSIANFFQLLGKAFEAQTVIALINTALTCIGMWLLGIQGVGFLAVVVFVCSFIPIVGVFVSTVPICVVSLQVEGGGFGLMAGVIGMVTIVHIVEAYVLNPRIYGFHMKLHPLAVLIVLYVAQHLVGVWGLVIGVPLATYVWRFMILGDENAAAARKAAEGSARPAPG